ncbi:hypothetical protein ABB26_04940 [Stenotrophomonas humi]|uniref:Uncharacterized protein n=1 Tax=Stenotrophomonas humi TaxID=405444 RepID=A0A0R0C634_9GAMM|nr:hypothetical protein ABB26_04940 [Stenotrophomonas humi]
MEDIGIRQLRYMLGFDHSLQFILAAQLATAIRPSGSCSDSVAPLTWYVPTKPGADTVDVLAVPLQFAELPYPEH